MISQREIERRHSKLIIEEAEPNRFNTYVCQNPGCKAAIKTVDIHVGVTPMFLRCDNCGSNAGSTGYRDTLPDSEPNFEWYVPDLKELMKWRRNEAMLDHIFKGGLLSRPYKKPKTGIQLIQDERIRQIRDKGYDEENDDKYMGFELARTASVLASPSGVSEVSETEVNIEARVKELTKAGALCAAEIDRLKRLQSKENKK